MRKPSVLCDMRDTYKRLCIFGESVFHKSSCVEYVLVEKLTSFLMTDVNACLLARVLLLIADVVN